MPIALAVVSINLVFAGAARAYHVRPGDSLSAIAVRFGTTVASLERVNGLSPGATLLAGSELRLSLEPALRTYKVAPGDTLTAIAQTFHSSVGAIAHASGLKNTQVIPVGAVLKVPLSAGAIARASRLRNRQVIPAGAVLKAPLSARIATPLRSYRVRTGDTLTAIAQTFHSSVGAIAHASGLKNTQVIPVGAVLKVPLSAGAIARASRLRNRQVIPAGAVLKPPLSARIATPLRSYRVRTGDSLSVIAARFSVALGALAALNHLELRDVLLAGRTLILPAQARTMLGALPVSAPASPYPAGSIGYDISYPNCDLEGTPAHSFVVIGVNEGRPFTSNPCFAREYRWALASGLPPSIYLNSSYSPLILDAITPGCRAMSLTVALGERPRDAYALGCSEAVSALAATPVPLPADAVLWIDVEISNSWSADQALNTATLEGMLAYLGTLSPAPVVGLYSNSAWWQAITGGWAAAPIPEWSPDAAQTGSGCAPSFAGGPVWLSQSIATVLDTDHAC